MPATNDKMTNKNKRLLVPCVNALLKHLMLTSSLEQWGQGDREKKANKMLFIMAICKTFSEY